MCSKWTSVTILTGDTNATYKQPLDARFQTMNFETLYQPPAMPKKVRITQTKGEPGCHNSESIFYCRGEKCPNPQYSYIICWRVAIKSPPWATETRLVGSLAPIHWNEFTPNIFFWTFVLTDSTILITFFKIK